MLARVKAISSVAEAAAHAQKTSSRRVLVPTMGALHMAHLELIRVGREHAGHDGEVGVSIFVNPLQFEPGSDYERYPRPEKDDEDFCRDAGVDILFRPRPEEMYFDDRSVFVEETSLSKTLCGKSRSGHFRGVCTVVMKLFNILTPDAAVFGEKDFQQLAIIRRMVRDLNLAVGIVGVPIMRESDGLASSSRNIYLNSQERGQATFLHRALLTAAELARQGECSAEKIIAAARKIIETAPLARIDYVEIVDSENLEAIRALKPNSRMALAVFFGKTRLIDNIQLP